MSIGKIELDFDSVMKYLDCSLEGANKLTSILMKLNEFRSGHFYTLLPESTVEADIYIFRQGLATKMIKEHTINMVHDYLCCVERLFCIFDDVTSTTPIENYELYEKYGAKFEKEAYYILPPGAEKLHKLIKQCFNVSNAIWHSLCILYRDDSPHRKMALTEGDMRQICLNAQLIIVGAYDGEGYVFWERSDLL